MRLAKALFGQVGNLVGQIKDQVGQGQGQELDNTDIKMRMINIWIVYWIGLLDAVIKHSKSTQEH